MSNQLKALFFIPLLFVSFSLAANEKITLEKDKLFYNLSTHKEEMIDLNNNKHKVIVFLSKDCPCSKANLSLLNQYSEEFADVEFIGIHAMKNKSPNDLKSFDTTRAKFPIFNDDQLVITNLFKAVKTPHVFIVSPTNEIIYQGGVTNSMMPEKARQFYLKDALMDLKNKKAIVLKETKTLGCYIVR